MVHKLEMFEICNFLKVPHLSAADKTYQLAIVLQATALFKDARMSLLGNGQIFLLPYPQICKWEKKKTLFI